MGEISLLEDVQGTEVTESQECQERAQHARLRRLSLLLRPSAGLVHVRVSRAHLSTPSTAAAASGRSNICLSSCLIVAAAGLSDCCLYSGTAQVSGKKSEGG